MQLKADIEGEKTGASRALVPLTVASDAPRTCPRANAAFVTQLAANAKGLSQYRAKRRVQPEDGAMRYRTTIAEALAHKPKGKNLNYVA